MKLGISLGIWHVNIFRIWFRMRDWKNRSIGFGLTLLEYEDSGGWESSKSLLGLFFNFWGDGTFSFLCDVLWREYRPIENVRVRDVEWKK